MTVIPEKWPDDALEHQMIHDADVSIGTSEEADDASCHVRALLSRVRELETESARLRAALQAIQEMASDAIRHGCDEDGGGWYWQIEADARAALGMPKEEDA